MNEITVARSVAQVSIEDLASAAQIPSDTIALWESPRCPLNEKPTYSEFLDLADVLEVEVSYLAGKAVLFPTYMLAEGKDVDFRPVVRQERIDDEGMFYLLEDKGYPEGFLAVVYRPASCHYLTRCPWSPQPRHATEIASHRWRDPYFVEAPLDGDDLPLSRCRDEEKILRLSDEAVDSWVIPRDADRRSFYERVSAGEV